ncbi:hypothetical protein ACFU8W_23750 [Streptomyces sp. NPDC057565]|uniref:hypothetical protein n=1 Tax=unclassified Streptomyces TaxID=2593676 RepID=UPI003694EEAE
MTTARLVPLEELPSLVGEVFTIDSFRITEDEVNTFEDVTGVSYSYRIHANDYPDGMIEGFHSLALVDHLSVSLVRPDPKTTFVFNYGANRLRFPSGLTTKDKLSYRLEVLDVVPRGDGYLLTYDSSITAHGADRPGMRVEWLTAAYPLTAGTELRSEETVRPTPFQPKVR